MTTEELNNMTNEIKSFSENYNYNRNALTELRNRYYELKRMREEMIDEYSENGWTTKAFALSNIEGRMGGAFKRMSQNWMKKHFSEEDCKGFIEYIKREGGDIIDYWRFIKGYMNVYAVQL